MAERARRQTPAAWKLEALERVTTLVTCAVCASVYDLRDIQYDHHLALIDGGDHASANIRPVCKTCHAKKSAREHKNNSKSKRIAEAQRVHEAVVERVMKREPSRLKGQGFDKRYRKRMDRTVVKR